MNSLDLALPAHAGPAVGDWQGEMGGDEPSRDIRAGLIVAFLFFGLLVGWAAIARLDAAALAPGRLVVSGQRQTVQHRDGGVVGQIMVREGQRVERGQILMRLAGSEVRAQERSLSAQAISLLAQRARIRAEQMGSGTIAVPAEFAQLTSPEDRADATQAMNIQRTQLRTRLAVVNAKRASLGQRTSGAGNQGAGYTRQVAALDKQIASVDEELKSLSTVAEKGFVSMSRIRALERAKAELEGQRGQYSATVAQSRDQAGESRLQALEAQSDYLERSATELRDVELALAEVLPKLSAARDQASRLDIRSPASGMVVGLQVFTPGGVIAPGQKLLDVVPERTPMNIEVRLSIADGDDVSTGQTAYVRFDALHERRLSPLEGKVTRVSADSFTDEKTGESYFTATIEVPQAELEKLKVVRGDDFELRAGMPVTVEIPVRKRTALQYMLEPLTSALNRSGREH
ncbi:HlyD family type I secretion periplasmic adaptor subunit [Sphingomonas swuensis]|uniref:Membrane fusion protein (MFP) family protein n=1 Tax=Sphingomonas swuensis TaxID=977800 RepID=A0ABP7ST30_9SPHN